MRNLKRYLAVFVAVAVMLTAMAPVFAASAPTIENEAAANTLHDLGLYAGISTSTFDPDLATALDRETGVSMIVKLLGKDADATAMAAADVSSVLAAYKDASSISDWAKPYVAYAIKNGMVKGNGDGTFGPKTALLGKAYCTMILRNMGFEPQDYNTAAFELVSKGGLSYEQAVKYNAAALIKDGLVGISLAALNTADKDGVTLIGKLIADNVVDADKAEAAGVYKKTVDEEAVKAKAAAETAVAAYEAATAFTLDEIAAADKLEAAANDAIANVKDEADKAAFAERVATKKADVDELRGIITPGTVSVETNNLGNIVLNFSKPVLPSSVPWDNDGDTPVTPDPATIKIMLNNSYTNLITSGAQCALSADKKKLTIAYPSNLAQYDKIRVIIDGVKDSGAYAFAKLDQTYTVSDLALPSVTGIQVGTSNLYKKLVVTTTEPLAVNITSLTNLDASTSVPIGVKLDGVVARATATVNKSYNMLYLNFGSNMTEGKHTIDIYGAKDIAGFMMQPYSGTFEVTYDKTAPKAVSATITGTQSATVAFDENIVIPTTGVVITVKEYNQPTSIYRSASVDGVNLKIKFTQKLSTFSLTSPVTITVSGITDKAGNVMAGTQTLTGTLVDDVTPPSISNAYMMTAKQLKAEKDQNASWGQTPANSGTVDWDLSSPKAVVRVNFSEACNVFDAASAPKAIWKLYKTGTTTPIVATITAVWSGEDGHYDYQIPWLMTQTPGTSFTLTFEGVRDYSLRNNYAPTLTTDFTVIDVTIPAISEAVRVGNDRLNVRFTEDMDSASVSDLTKYLVSVPNSTSGSVYRYVSEITDARVDAQTSNVVTLYIPGCNVVGNANYVTGFAIIGAKDMGGNLLPTYNGIGNYYTTLNATSGSIVVADMSAQAIAKNQIKVTLANGHTFRTADPSSFKFYAAGHVGDATYAYDLGVATVEIATDGKSAILTLSGNNLGPDGKVSITIGNVTASYALDLASVAQTGTTDELNRDIVISANGVTLADKIAPMLLTDVRDGANANVFCLETDVMLDYNSNLAAYDTATKNYMLALGTEIKLADGTVLVAGTDYTMFLSAGSNPFYSIVITITKPGLNLATLTIDIKNPALLVERAGGNNTLIVKTATVVNVTTP